MAVKLDQQAHILQLQRHTNSLGIDNVAVLTDKVSVLVGMSHGGAWVK